MVIIPTYVFGASARYNQLVSEKQRKIEELEKCSGNINGWKIAGISTLGLTAVGVAGNIALSNTQKDYDKKIEKTDKQISDTQENIEKLEEQKRLAAAEQMAREQCERAGGTYNNGVCTCNETGKVYQNGACVAITVTTVTQPQQPTTVQPTDTTDCTDEAKAKDENVIKATKNGDKCEVVACVDTHIVKADKTGCELKSENTSKTPTVADGTDCTDTAKKTDANVTKAQMQDGKCVVVACVDTHIVKADKTGCELKSENTSKTPTVANGTDCTDEMLKKDKNVAEAKIKNGKCEVISCVSTHDVNKNKNGCVKKSSGNNNRSINACVYNNQTYKANETITGKGTEVPFNKVSVCKESGVKDCKCTCVNNNWACEVDSCINDFYDLKQDSSVTDAHHPFRCVKLPPKNENINNVFNDTQVNLEQGKKLVEEWARLKNIGQIKCDNTYTSQGNDNVLKCTAKNTVYSILFDDLNESLARTAHKSIAKKICELYGGKKVTEPDTGISAAIRCDLPTSVSCGDLNASLRRFSGFKAESKSVYNTSNVGGYHQTLAYVYCKISW